MTHTLKPSCRELMTSHSLLTGHVSTTLMAAHMSYMDTTLFRSSGRYVLTSMSFTNPSSAGVSDGALRWLSRSVANAPVRMCVLAMVLVR